MTLVVSTVEALRYVSFAVFAGVLARLALTGLYRRYKYFAVYLAVSLVRSLVLAWFPGGTSAYANAWALSEPLVWIPFVLLVWEIHNISTVQYPGMRGFGRTLLLAFGAAAVLIAAGSIGIDCGAQPQRWPHLAVLFVVRRSLTTALLLFLVIEAGFFAFFPVPAQRNALVHSRMAALYFLLQTSGNLILNLVGDPRLTPSINVGHLTATALLMLTWGLLLSPAAEEAPAYPERTLEESLKWKRKSEELELALKSWARPRRG